MHHALHDNRRIYHGNNSTKRKSGIGHGGRSGTFHKKDKAKAVAQTKAKVRLRRLVLATAAVIPVGGLVVTPVLNGYFEKSDFDEWKTNHPDKNVSDYICESSE